MSLPLLGREPGVLADGSVHLFDAYQAEVLWDDTLRTIAVQAADADPLVGMRLLRGHDLRIRVVAGGEVTVTAL